MKLIKLRPYQAKAVRKIKILLKAGDRPLCYAPTAAGKTEIAGAVFMQVKHGPKVFVVHTDQLRAQASARLGQYGVDVVTIQSLLLAPDLFKDATIVCFDECHHLQGQKWREAMSIFAEGCAVFGLTATPYAKMLSELFTAYIVATTIQAMNNDGYSVPISIMRREDAFVETMQDGERINGALAYNKHFRGRQAIHFEPKIVQCEEMAQQYEKLGIVHAVITGETPSATRDAQIMRFRDRKIQVLISPVLLSEGFDAPCAEIVVAGRAFESDVLTQQAAGRVRRSHPGKTEAWILDCTGCCDGKTPDYFNSTDEKLFASLGESDRGEQESSSPKKGRAACAIVWVECNLWDVQRPDLAKILQRAEYADILEAARIDAKTRENRVSEAKKEAIRASRRHVNMSTVQISRKKAYVKKCSKDPTFRKNSSKASAKYLSKKLSDPVIGKDVLQKKRNSCMQSYRKKRSSLDGVEKMNAAAKKAYKLRMEDPIKREARRLRMAKNYLIIKAKNAQTPT